MRPENDSTSSRPDTATSRRTALPPLLEPLEFRTLLAVNPTAAQTDNQLSAMFGGSMIFPKAADDNGGGTGTTSGTGAGDTNRLHAVLNVETQTDTGALAGRLDIDGLGKFRFNGAATN